jgi:ParB family chromosome partitioning protein
MEIALIENLQREDLNSIEEAYAYKSLIEEYNMTQEEISKRIGKSRPAIANSLRLLQLPEEVKEMVAAGKISQGHARALLSVGGAKKQIEIANKIVDQQLNVRQIEKLAKDSKEKKNIKREPGPEQLEIKQIEERLKAHFSTKVNLKYKKNKGKIEIEYYSNEELERILEMMGIKGSY